MRIKESEIENKLQVVDRQTFSRGISLIVLVITIIVVVILAVAVIISIANNNPIQNAKEATQKNNDATLLEQANVIYSYWYQEHQLGKITEEDAEEYVRSELQKHGFEKYDYVHVNDGKVASVLYKELEYIESTGTQYIDTGLYPDSNTTVYMDYQISSFNYSITHRLFGVATASNSTTGLSYNFYASTNQNSWGFSYKDNQPNFILLNEKLDTNRHTILFDGYNKIIDLDNGRVTQSLSNYDTTQTSDHEMVIFACNQLGIYKYHSIMKLYSCKVYENGILIMNLIPCKTSLNEIGMYDTVNYKFYSNAGTGEFVPGDEV